MRFPDDDDETVVDTAPPAKPKKASKWIIVAAFFELIGDLLKSFAQFFDALEDESLARFRYERSQQDFQEQASREIEMLTSGEYDAATAESVRSKRTGSSFEED